MHKLRDIKRFNKVVETLINYEFGLWLHKIGLLKKSKNGFPFPSTEPEILRSVFEDLGGTFVKLGQFLSLRPDLIPRRYCDEFSKLQDSVKPFPKVEAVKIIENHLDLSFKKVFSEFSSKPIASASIGEVFKAKLHNGKYVAVKVKRPGIDDIVGSDLDILKFFAVKFRSYFKLGIVDPVEIVEELDSYTRLELNFLNELTNLEKFSSLNDNACVFVPRPYREFSSSDVLVMDFLDGVPLEVFLNSNPSFKLREKVSSILLESFLHQVFLIGFFHADPHPGNIFIKKHKDYVHVNLLDFGIVGEVDASLRKGLLSLFLALMSKDLDGIADSLYDLHLVDRESPGLKRQIKDLLGPYYNVSFDKIDLPRLFMKSLDIARYYGVKVPKDYVLLGKALATLQGVCVRVNPKFNIVGASQSFVDEYIASKFFPKNILKEGVSKSKSYVSSIVKLPSFVRKYVESQSSQANALNNLDVTFHNLEKDIDLWGEKILLFILGVFLIIAGLIFYFNSSFNSVWPLVIILELVGVAFFIVAALIKSSK
ncbi:hypothetical protein K9L97_05875 [Candidatus Woesearchaeota archaeon]|nr:hypothetical protein [Candidatus Woesearchaeota archaeon]